MQVFIADIRNCPNKEQEKTRVDKELGKIRKKFASGHALTGAVVFHIPQLSVFGNSLSFLGRELCVYLMQNMTGRNTSGNYSTYTCSATRWSLVTNRQPT